MKNKITYNNIQSNINKAPHKNIKTKKNVIFFTPPDTKYTSFIQQEKLKNIFYTVKEKDNYSKITNNVYKKNSKIIKTMESKKNNKSITFTNINNIFNNKIINKKNYINKKNKSKSKIKTKYIKKINDNINLLNDKKKNIILNNYQRKKITLKNNQNNLFSGKQNRIYDKEYNSSFIFTDYKHKNKDSFKNCLYKDSFKLNSCQMKIDFEQFSKYNEIKMQQYGNNKIIYINKFKRKNNILLKYKIKKQYMSLNRNENKINNNYIPKNIPINLNMNNSSKLTNISSYVTSERNNNSKIGQNKILNKNNDINLMKEIFLLKLKSVVNEKDTQEYESHFLNYELGFSDKVSTINNNYLNDKIYNNKDIIGNECEKPAEEIEKIANEIYNSEYRNRRISYLNNLDLNNNIEELKNGEGIQNILSLIVNKKNK